MERGGMRGILMTSMTMTTMTEMTEMTEPHTLRLILADDEIIHAPAAVTRYCGLLRDISDDMGHEQTQTTPIPLGEVVDAENLRRVIHFCSAMCEIDDDAQINKGDGEAEKDKWTTDYVSELTNEELKGLLKTCDYMAVEKLLDAGCADMGWRMRDLSVAQIRDLFHLEDDLTAEQKQQIEKDMDWLRRF